MQKMYDRMQTQNKDTRLYDHKILNVVNELCMNYKIQPNDILEMGTRKEGTIEAKRLLVYYLSKCKDVSHNKMKKYINGMHHATSIYHQKRLEELFKIEKKLQKLFLQIVHKCDPEKLFEMKKNPILKTELKEYLYNNY